MSQRYQVHAQRGSGQHREIGQRERPQQMVQECVPGYEPQATAARSWHALDLLLVLHGRGHDSDNSCRHDASLQATGRGVAPLSVVGLVLRFCSRWPAALLVRLSTLMPLRPYPERPPV